MARPRKLTNEVKRYIVRALACFETPTQVAESVKEAFGLALKRQRIAAYDPEVKAGAKLSKAWRDEFYRTRKAFLRDTNAIGISHLPYRLRAIERMLLKAEAAGDTPLALRCLQQAAEDAGGIFTNARVVTTRDPYRGIGMQEATDTSPSRGRTLQDLADRYAESIGRTSH